MRWISTLSTRSLVSRVAIGFVAWTAVGLFFSSQFHLINHQLKAPVGWALEVHLALVNWYTWGLLTVLVFALARRFPVDGVRWRSRVAFHAFWAAAVSLLHVTLCASWHWLVSHEADEWLWMFQRMFVWFFHWDVLIYAGILVFSHAWTITGDCATVTSVPHSLRLN